MSNDIELNNQADNDIKNEVTHISESLTLATRQSRLAAQLLDVIISSIILLSIFFLLFPDMQLMNAEKTALAESVIVPLTTISMVSFLLINIWFMKKGQTLGKKIMNIYVAKINTDEAIGFKQYFFIRMLLFNIIGSIPIIKLLNLVDIAFIFKKDQRCLHDLLAKTHVLKIPS